MSVLVVGTVALDTVETPEERHENVLGGSATFFGHSAAPFGPVRLVSVVGDDFPAGYEEALRARGVDTEGLERTAGKTFHWEGRYTEDWNVRETIRTDLNVIEDYRPRLPETYRRTPFVFLANAHPAVQGAVLDQIAERPKFVVCDTMNLWIDTALDDLLELLRRVDGVVLNDEEARMLTGERSLIRAGRKILEKGPKVVVLKKGEHGAFLFSALEFFALPAYPVERVVDPTGAGDSFAGGLLGSLGRTGLVTLRALRRSMVFGTVMASFAVESFGVERLETVGREDVRARFEELVQFFSL